MKILLLANHLNVGGITTYLHALCKYYRAKGHDVFLISQGGQREEEFVALGVKIFLAPLKTKSEVNPKVYFHFFRLLKIIREHHVDLIHGHTRVTQVLGYLLGRVSGIPFVSTCHGFYKLRWFRRAFRAWGDGVAAISPAVETHLLKDFHMPRKDVFLIPNGIDLQIFHPVSAQDRAAAQERFQIFQKPVIGIIARLADVKGHTYLISAMPEILKKYPQAILFIAGVGKMEAELKEQVKALQLEKQIIFASVFNQSMDVLSLLDVLVMPSLDEGFGLSGMEAQAAGIPVVASDVGGIPTFVHHEKTGLLVEPKNSLALAHAILRVLDDSVLAQRLGQQARQFIEQNFSAELTAEKTLKMYEAVLERKKR